MLRLALPKIISNNSGIKYASEMILDQGQEILFLSEESLEDTLNNKNASNFSAANLEVSLSFKMSISSNDNSINASGTKGDTQVLEVPLVTI